jgi:hemoglobin
MIEEKLRMESIMEANEMIQEFVMESRDNLDQFDEDLICLEETPNLPELMERIFRTIHTIKGSCGLIGFTKLESITHSGENLLDKIQRGLVIVSPEVMNALHDLSDSSRRIFTSVYNQGIEGDLDVSELIETLERLQKEKPATSSNENSNDASSLFDKLGGQEAVDATVNLFYTKVLQDDRINHFFENTDLNYLLNKQKEFLTFAFGGPSNYDGKGLQAAHKHLVEEKGLNESHFDAVVENLGTALMDLKVPGDLIGEAARIAQSVKDDVLGRTTSAPPKEETVPDVPGNENPSLFDKLGGQEAVDATVNLFYTKVLQDDRINHFFEGTDLNYLLNKQKEFLTFAFGGPSNYDGKGLQAAHKHLVEEKGLNESHFDAVVENLGTALMDLKVPGDLIGEAARIAQSVKDDVLGRTTSAPPKEEEKEVAVVQETVEPPAPATEEVVTPPTFQ